MQSCRGRRVQQEGECASCKAEVNRKEKDVLYEKEKDRRGSTGAVSVGRRGGLGDKEGHDLREEE